MIEVDTTRYHKIQTMFFRDPDTNYKTLLYNQWALPEFQLLCHCVWKFTEKVDGTNIRITKNDSGIHYGGRTDRAQIPVFLYDRLVELFADNKGWDLFNTNPESEIVLYGEGFGNRIQKAGKFYNKDGVDFVLFDVRINDVYMPRVFVEEVASEFELQIVPIIGQGSLLDAYDIAKWGFTSHWGDFGAEGIVARPDVELLDRHGNRIITKIKHKDFSK